MARKIPLSDFETAIVKELSEYSDEVAEDIKRDVKRVAKETVQALRTASPRDTGEYAKGWSDKVEYENANDIRVRVYNKKKPQLTHLLENGHAKKNGGRVDGKPHIGPVEQEAEKKLQNGIKVVVKG